MKFNPLHLQLGSQSFEITGPILIFYRPYCLAKYKAVFSFSFLNALVTLSLYILDVFRLKCFKISLVVVSNVSVALFLLFVSYENGKNLTLYVQMLLNFQMILRSLLWTTSIPPSVLLKDFKNQRFAIFSCYYPFYVRFI